MGVRRARLLKTAAVTVLGTALAIGPAAGAGAGTSGATGTTGTSGAAGSGGGTKLRPVVTGLDGPRGVAVTRKGDKVVYSVADGSVYEAAAGGTDQSIRKLGQVPASFIAPAIDTNARGVTYALTVGGPPGSGAGTLYKLRPGKSPWKVADISAYQQKDPDPYNTEGEPTESNPFGVAALRDGTVLVADAAGNDLLRVWPNGQIKTVARFKPRTVRVPEGLPPTDPEGHPLPPAGTLVPSESVPTSVTVGSDGHYYVGELRGFPANPGKSQIWRIRPGSVGAVCDPAKPSKGSCQRYADGFTSIVDLGAGSHKRIYVVELAKVGWLQWELGGSPVGSLYEVFRGRNQHAGYKRELVPGQLTLPAGVGVSKQGKVYVSSPVFGPGGVSKVTHR